MAKKYAKIPDRLRQFIEEQKIFFIATAAAGGRINLSPKGLDSLKVFDKNRVIWLNLTGSGNETSAHTQENPRMTIMFAAFKGQPMILRLYGQATVIHKSDGEWESLYSLFPADAGARQIVDVAVDLVSVSCGMGVPFFDYVGERQQLKRWGQRKGGTGRKRILGEDQSAESGRQANSYHGEKQPLISRL